MADGPRTTHVFVRDALREAIVRGDLKSGVRLIQNELAEQYGVSTTPVREALATLQRQGLVQHHPQRGAVVFLPTVDDLRHHYEIRAALEALAAAKAAERFEAAWAPPLAALLDEMGEDVPAATYIALNQRFHTTLYEHSARTQLVAMIAALRDASSAYLHIYRAAEDFPAARLDSEHRAILAACVARDPQRAAAATREHLENTVEHVASKL